jgi:hypothetical protein
MTEDFLAVVETKRFLGREFLTWLVHRLETAGGRIAEDGVVVELALGDSVVLAGGAPDKARTTVVGAGDLSAEMGAGLRRGKLLDRAALVLTHGERRWELTLDGGLLAFDGLRCPPLGERGDRSDPRAALENDLFLRLADVEQALGVVDRLFAEFCSVRGGRSWTGRELPALRAWVDELR